MSDAILENVQKFVNECEFESTQEAVEAGFGIVGLGNYDRLPSSL